MTEHPLSHTRMTRSRLYTLIDSFEADIRRLLIRYILDHLEEEVALGPSFAKAAERCRIEESNDHTSIVEYLDLQESYDILNRHRLSLPADLGDELRSNTRKIYELVGIRNRVMHGRPLLTGDAEKAISVCGAFTTRYWTTTCEALRHLEKDPAWEPVFEVKEKPAERILHNLPLPEYDETGLIGRSSDCKQILKHLRRRREPIITVVGEGGIGKTAVALEAAYSLLDDADCPFECILWVSLKTEKLTTGGVISISDAVKDVAGAARQLGQAVITDFSGGVADLARLLEGVSTLLIIDNLETITGTEITTLYDELPDSVSYLFTSRVGVGQFERRIVLNPLVDRDACILFRNFAKARNISRLLRISDQTVHETVSRLRNSPLAIRWYILSVEAGREPHNLLSNQDELLDFCVRSVYDRLGIQAQTVLSVLYSLDRDSTFDELAVLTDGSIDDLRSAVHDLLASSLTILEPDNENQLVSRVRLTEVSRQFLRRVNPPSARIVEAILVKERELRESEGFRRAEEQARSLAPNVVRVQSAYEQPVAYLLRLALLSSKEEDISKATEYINRARALNAEYWEVDRVEAFILSSAGQVEQATALYRSALRKIDTEGAAVVSYFFAGHLARKASDLRQGLEYAIKAHSYFQSSETAQLLGAILVWSGNFAEGQEYLEYALDDARGRSRLITLTSLVDSWRQWSDYLIEHEHSMLDAFYKASAGYALGSKEMRKGTYDIKLAESVLGCCASAISAITMGSVEEINFGRPVVDMLEFIRDQHLVFENCRSWIYFPECLSRLSRFSRSTPTILALCQEIFARSGVTDMTQGRTKEVLVGRFRNWQNTYGFIEHSSYPEGIFCPASVIENLNVRGEEVDLRGRSASFTIGPSIGPSGDTRSERADWVRLDDPVSS
jgi:tetratricopeptide (TPR) repeat protein